MKNLKNYIISFSITLGIYCYNNLYLPDDTSKTKNTNIEVFTDNFETKNEESKSIVTNRLNELVDEPLANTQLNDINKSEIDKKIKSMEISEDNNQFTDYMTLENLC